MKTLTGPMQLLMSAWAAFKAHRKLLLALTLIPTGLSCIGQLAAPAQALPLVILGAAASIAGGILSIAMQPALIGTAHRISAEPGAVLSAKGQFGFGFKYFWIMLGLGIMQGLILIGSGIFFIIPALIVGVYGCLYMFTRIIDGKKGFSSFAESYSLVKGKWAGVLGRGLFLVLVYMVLGLAVAGLAFLLGKAFGWAANSAAFANATLILNLALNAFMIPVTVLYSYGLYAALKPLRAPDAAPEKFRKWLVFFLVVGALVIIAIPAAAIALSAVPAAVPHI